MRGMILVVCAVVAGGAFLVMYFSLWNTRNERQRSAIFRQHIVSELAWATVPLLMLVAAAAPAALTIMAPDPSQSAIVARSGVPQMGGGQASSGPADSWLNARRRSR